MNQSVIFCVSCLVAVAVVAPLAQAEPEIIKAIPLQVHEERLRIQRLRLEYEAIDQQAQADCYAKFAVSDCLRAARAKKRFVLDDLRRQEVILNDLDRHTKAIEALNKIQEKSLADAKRLDAKP